MATLGHIVLFFANGIGDHFMSAPALRLVRTVPCSRLTLMWRSGLKEVFFDSLGKIEYKEVNLYRRHARWRFDINALTDHVPRADIFLCLQPWHAEEIDILIKKIRAGKTIGFHQSYDLMRPREAGEHYVDVIFKLAATLRPGAQVAKFSSKPCNLRRWRSQASPILGSLPSDARILAWQADTKPQKQWHAHRFAAVLLQFLDNHPDHFAIGVGFDNMAVRRLARHPRLIAVDQLPLSTNLGLLAASDLFLGIDSCMLHAADFLRIPGVGLFGPSPDAPGGSDSFGFRFGPHVHISGQGSILDIAERDVLQALEELVIRSRAAGERE